MCLPGATLALLDFNFIPHPPQDSFRIVYRSCTSFLCKSQLSSAFLLWCKVFLWFSQNTLRPHWISNYRFRHNYEINTACYNHSIQDITLPVQGCHMSLHHLHQPPPNLAHQILLINTNHYYFALAFFAQYKIKRLEFV